MPDRCTDNPRDCPLVPRVEALERANEQHSATHREIFGRLGTLESMTAVQDTQLKNMDTKLDDIKNDNKSILAKIEALEARPGKRWDTLVASVLSAAAGAFAALVLHGGLPG